MPRHDDFILSAAERHRKQRRRRRIYISLGAVILLALIAVFVARPIRNAIHSWQARRHAAKAIVFINQQKWNEARDEATAGYQLQPKEPQAVRAVALLLSRAGQGDALEFWKNLADLTPLTPDDLREEARVALRVNDNARAGDATAKLLAQKNPATADWLLAAEVDARKQLSDEAKAYLDKVLRDPRASRREKLQANVTLGNIAFALGDSVNPADIEQRVATLAKGSDDVSLDALMVLASRAAAAANNNGTKLSSITPEEIESAIDAHPLAKTQQKLVATDLKIAQHPGHREELIDETVARFQKSDNDSLLALAGWLYRNGEFQRLINAIPLQRALQSRELFLQYVDALGALNRWDDIRKIIEAERFPLDPMIEHMYLARCFAQQGQQNGAENNWQRALEDAAGNVAKLITLGEYAEKNNAGAIAGKAFEAAAATSPKSRAAQQGRLRVAYHTRDTKQVHEILGEMLKIWPNDIAVQNDEAYTRLLLMTNDERRMTNGGAVVPSPSSRPPIDQPSTIDQQLTTIKQLAEDLVRREPASLPHRTLLALVLLKQNRPADALAVYKDLKVPANAVSPSALVVHAAVLAANGHYTDAGKEFSQAPAEKLLPEEAALRSLLPRLCETRAFAL